MDTFSCALSHELARQRIRKMLTIALADGVVTIAERHDLDSIAVLMMSSCKR
jgi:hypothetical protein